MKEEYISAITQAMQRTEDIALLDLIYQIQGEPLEVLPLSCKVEPHKTFGEDFGMAVFEYADGVSFAKTSACERGGFLRRQLVVTGTKGTIELKPFEVGCGPLQYTEKQMRRRIRKLRFQLWRAGGVDVVVTHAPPLGVGDLDDPAHMGFRMLKSLLERYKPMYLLHGHIHFSYGMEKIREREYGETKVINASERYVLEIPDREFPEKRRNHPL